jgi:hypothetical protein
MTILEPVQYKGNGKREPVSHYIFHLTKIDDRTEVV